MGNELQRSNAPPPPGAMVQVGVENIDEGNLMRQINAAIGNGLKALKEYEEAAGKFGSLQVGVSLTFERLKGSDSIWTIKSKVTKRVPEHQQMSTANEKGGRLLCQPIGTNDDVRQQVFFDHRGQVIGADGHPVVIDQDKDSIPIDRARRAQA